MGIKKILCHNNPIDNLDNSIITNICLFSFANIKKKKKKEENLC